MWNPFLWFCKKPEVVVEVSKVEVPKVEVPKVEVEEPKVEVVPEPHDYTVEIISKKNTWKTMKFDVTRTQAESWRDQKFSGDESHSLLINDSNDASFLRLRIVDIDYIRCYRKKAETPKSLQADSSAVIPRRFDYKAIDPSMLQDAQDILRIIGPYLPALRRVSDEVYEGFLKYFQNKEWEEIDALLYEKMTDEERKDLLDSVYQGAREAAIARFERIKLEKELAWKILTSILIKIVL